MKHFKLIALAVLLALVGMVFGFGNGLAASTNGATITLSASQDKFSADQGVIVQVPVSNLSNRPVKVLKWYTPAEDVEEPLFTVTRDGNAVAFTGPHYKRPAPTGNDYLVLKPGESLVRDVDLAAWYDFSLSGNYEVRYDIGSWNLYSEKGNAFKTVESLNSNSLTFAVEGRAANLFNDAAMEAAAGTTTFNKCTTTQQTDLLNARNNAVTYANNAVSYLNGSQSTRFTTWFGVYNSSRHNTVKNNFNAISNAMTNASVKFDCGCKKTYYAYVYPNQPYNIYLCRAFWSAPMTGTDSKAGTLIHEMSHFSVVAGTDDWAYGQTNAKNLAISDPNKAIDNADNHEYFAENTPALP